MSKKKKKKQIKVKRSWIVDIPIGACVLLIIAGIVLCAMIFVIWREGRSIDKSEAISASGAFDSYTTHYSPKGSVNEIEIRFKDREQLYMDSAYFNVTIEASLDQLADGEQLHMLLHPSSEDIWEMKTEEATILHFEEAKQGIRSENIGFSIMFGAFGALSAIMGTTSLILQLAEQKRKNRAARS